MNDANCRQEWTSLYWHSSQTPIIVGNIFVVALLVITHLDIHTSPASICTIILGPVALLHGLREYYIATVQ